MTSCVYGFSQNHTDLEKLDKEQLGSKGVGLFEMAKLGIPLPPGFTITTEVCRYFQEKNGFPPHFQSDVKKALLQIEKTLNTGARFGDPNHPLLVSVRSGAAASMPGMMDTILNLGLNDQTVAGLMKQTKNPRFAFDSYRRFIQMYSEVVLGLDGDKDTQTNPFETLLEQKKAQRGVTLDTELSAKDLEELTKDFKAEVLRLTQHPFPEDPWQQLWAAIQAVFRSWKNPRAVAYRTLYQIPENLGTAVTVQSMVFGNLGPDSATGVLFTRHPTSGEKKLYGEFLLNAQGEDVVAGIRTPLAIEKLASHFPKVAAQLEQVSRQLELHFRDMQDIEFTIQKGELWLLQTRSGKRCGKAMVKIAVDLVHEKVISQEEALLRMDPTKFTELFHPVVAPSAPKTILCQGLPASPGAVSGPIVFTPSEAFELAKQGTKAILVRTETSPEDIQGMQVSAGILTARGGMTSHAAVVARGMGRCCIVGAADIYMDQIQKQMRVGARILQSGDVITLDGNTGEVLLGTVPFVEPDWEAQTEYQVLMSWVDKTRRLRVLANADTKVDAKTARRFGAEGIGLCRTEHMFFAKERVYPMLRMILADSVSERKQALSELLPMQCQDFVALFTEMDGLPTTIRLLDPPLHEFLPKTANEEEKAASALKVPVGWIQSKKRQLHEENPMLGYRGCRLGILHPEIYDMQIEAIFQAVTEARRQEIKVICEIMVPLVGTERELIHFQERIQNIAKRYSQHNALPILVGTMIELPRACLIADRIALHADFFSFGTNDLTQTTLGLSRDDSGSFLPEYLKLGMYPEDPFVSLDIQGVGTLLQMAVKKGRATRPDLKIGICGEHGGDPKTIAFCHQLGLDYVSCSPYRVPIARLSAAQAALQEKTKDFLRTRDEQSENSVAVRSQNKLRKKSHGSLLQAGGVPHLDISKDAL